EAGEIRIELTETDVVQVLSEVVDSLEPLVDRSKVSLLVEADLQLPSVETDPDKLRQILLNLLSNAVKYTDEGSILVRATPADGGPELRVSDTGVGIGPDELGLIFEEFHRSDSTVARTRRGTGLGLSISRRLARALDGNLTVESRLGAGSTFTLDLPL